MTPLQHVARILGPHAFDPDKRDLCPTCGEVGVEVMRVGPFIELACPICEPSMVALATGQWPS
jgi:hypothetical protein